MEEKISEILLKQRIRNRIIEYFEGMLTNESILKYQKIVPIAWVSAEIFEQWYDVVHCENFDWYSPPVFSTNEIEEIRRFGDIIDRVSEETDIKKYKLEELIKTNQIQELIANANISLEIFQKRGRFDEEREEAFQLNKN